MWMSITPPFFPSSTVHEWWLHYLLKVKGPTLPSLIRDRKRRCPLLPITNIYLNCRSQRHKQDTRKMSSMTSSTLQKDSQEQLVYLSQELLPIPPTFETLQSSHLSRSGIQAWLSQRQTDQLLRQRHLSIMAFSSTLDQPSNTATSSTAGDRDWNTSGGNVDSPGDRSRPSWRWVPSKSCMSIY